MLAGHTPQSWKHQGPERTAAFSLWLYSLVWFWYLNHRDCTRWISRPWYPNKTSPSFADALALLPHNLDYDLPEAYDRPMTPQQPDHMTDWVNCIQSRGTPKCSTDEAFIETATFLMSLASQQEQRLVRWDAAREEIV